MTVRGTEFENKIKLMNGKQNTVTGVFLYTYVTLLCVPLAFMNITVNEPILKTRHFKFTETATISNIFKLMCCISLYAFFFLHFAYL